MYKIHNLVFIREEGMFVTFDDFALSFNCLVPMQS